jgi:voltage-gated potassium channel
VNPNVGSVDDALWYIIVTITSVGYGDIVPYTGFGRIIGVIAMLTAILFMSLVTATTTSALVQSRAGRNHQDKQRDDRKRHRSTERD